MLVVSAVFFRFHIPIFVEFTDDITRFWSSIKQLICCILFRRSKSYIIEISTSAADPLSYDIYHAIFSFYAIDFSQLISNNIKSAQAIRSLKTLLESGID